MCHGFKRRQSKAFVQRWEDEHLGGIVENPQHFNRNKSQEAHIIVHSASNDGAAQIGMLRKLVANDDELQVGIEIMFLQFGLQCRESFNDPHQILVRADASCIEQKRIGDLIAFRKKLPV